MDKKVSSVCMSSYLCKYSLFIVMNIFLCVLKINKMEINKSYVRDLSYIERNIKGTNYTLQIDMQNHFHNKYKALGVLLKAKCMH